MAELNRAGEVGSLGHIDTTQGDFRQQIDALTDITRQLGGNPTSGDPLNSPFVLYVNPFTGRDTFVGGSYTTTDNGNAESKFRRIELQRLECGYTEARPFKTINRAVLEAGIITSKAYFDLSPAPCGDLVSIVLAPGVHTVLNGDGNNVADISAWADGYEPDAAELQKFNTDTTGGLLLPRGCSLISLDLRKCIIRPDAVPTPQYEGDDCEFRRTIFLTTGGGYYYGFTVLDKEYDDPADKQSHHLLHVWEYSSKKELDEFYGKIRKAFSAAAGLNDAYAATRKNEHQIVGPLPATPSEPTDTVQGASPYVYNCSIRSELGMCSIFADGSKSAEGGFRSLVCAQVTGVSLQKDLRAYEKYESGTWVPCSNKMPVNQTAEYVDYIALDPNDVRPNPNWRSFHVRAINKAVIQEVSMFAIGQHIHHWVDKGGEVTITNSNSSFGNCACLAEGFRDEAQVFDQNWKVEKIRRPISPLSESQNIERIQLGTVKNYSNTNIELDVALAPSISNPNQPELLVNQGYSLKDGDFVWVDNPAGPDYRAEIDGANPWTNGVNIKITGGLETTTGLPPLGDDFVDPERPLPTGFRVYIRRLKDVRTVEERRYTFQISYTPAKPNRLPIRDYILQRTDGGADWSNFYTAVTRSEEAKDLEGKAVANNARIELRYSKRPSSTHAYDPSASGYYRKGDAIVQANKHWIANNTTFGAFDQSKWSETYVHMPVSFCPEGNAANSTPIIVFDGDTDGGTELTTDCGYKDLNSNEIQRQITSATDYQGAYWQLRQWQTPGEATQELAIQKNVDDRESDLSGNNWSAEMRRPSNARLYSHAWEWAGYGAYTKALPDYQGTMLPQNKFTYYFTNSTGGKVYASGFNEEGFQVTPRGVEDLATGEVLSVDDIGTPDRPIEIPTTFPGDLNVGGTLTAGTYKNLPPGKVDVPGIVAKASYADVGSTAKGTTAIDKSDVITVETLDKWKVANKLVSSGVTSAKIFVDPSSTKDFKDLNDLIDNPPNNPAARIKSLKAAVDYANTVFPSSALVEYRLAPGVYDEGFSRAAITFRTRATIRAWDMGKNEALNNYKEDGTESFLGTSANEKLSNYDDPTKQPIFPTYPYIRVAKYDFNFVYFDNRAVRFIFTEEASVTGCIWWGPNETLLSDQVKDSSFYSPYNVDINGARTSAKADPDNAYNYFVREAMHAVYVSGVMPDATTYRFYGVRGGPYLQNSDKRVIVNNCAMGPLTPSYPDIYGGIVGDAFISCGSGAVQLMGLYLFGQLRISSEVNVDVSGKQFSKIRYRAGNYATSSYAFTGSCYNFITSTSSQMQLMMGKYHTFDTSINGYKSNHRWSNINLIAKNNSGDWERASRTDVAGGVSGGQANWKKCGPAFWNFAYPLEEYKTSYTENPGRFWNRFHIQKNEAQGTASNPGTGSGFDGKFGQYCYDLVNDSPNLSGTIGGSYSIGNNDDTKDVDGNTKNSVLSRGFKFTTQNTLKLGSLGLYSGGRVDIFTPAGKGALREGGATPWDVSTNQTQDSWVTETAPNGTITNYLKHNYMNIELRGVRSGCDVTTGNVVFDEYGNGGFVL